MDEARRRVQRLFDFLEAFNQKRNPVIRQLDRHEKRLWWSDLHASRHVRMAEFNDPSDGDDQGDDDSVVLRVTRPQLQIPEAPRPPADLEVWLAPGWNDPKQEVSWEDSRYDPERGLVSLGPEDEARLTAWKEERDRWAAEIKEDREAYELFQWLWEVHATLEREGERYELVLGDGILCWRPGDGEPAMHPLIIQRLQLEFDPNRPAFTVVEDARPPELYAGLLRALGVDAAAIAQLRDTLFEGGRPHPLGAEATDDFLGRAASTLHPNGRFLGFDSPPPSRDFPQIVRAPVLFLRTRALGFEAAIQAIKQHLAAGGEVPESLSALVGIHPPRGDDVGVVDPFEQGDEAEDVLLTKEANREQLEIARRLARYGAVLVQGPPGTGKTHTIANLIGHLLANGKSVLVTSYTTKALRVLRDKVVPELRPLCVSVLEGDQAGNQQLNDSVTEIERRLSSKSEEQLIREAEQLSERRRKTLARISAARTELLDLVHAEYSSIVIAGKEYSPAEAAGRVGAGKVSNSWIPGRVLPDVPLPLSLSEVRTLYESNQQVSPADIADMSGKLPDPGELPTPEEFERTQAEKAKLTEIAASESAPWLNMPRTEEAVRAFADQMRAAYAGLGPAPLWYRTALDAAMHGDDEARPWRLLLEALQDWADALRHRRLAQQTFAVSLGSPAPAVTFETVDQILARLKSGKPLAPLGWRWRMPGAWKRLFKQVTVLGAPPSTIEHFEALKNVLLPDRKLSALMPRWEALMTPAGVSIPDNTGDPEREARRFAEELQDAIETRPARIRAAANQARALGFDLDRFADRTSAIGADQWAAIGQAVESRLQSAVDVECARLRLSEIGEAEQALTQSLSTFPGYADPNRPAGQLLTAIDAGEPAAYRLAYAHLTSLRERRSIAEQRAALLARLAEAAPEWAEAIAARQPPHDESQPPGDPLLAWEWKQLAQKLDSRKGRMASDLVAEVQELRQRLREETTQLIDRRAWAMQARNTDPAARQALRGYVELVKKIGKGTGRRAPRLREAAREQMTVARRAVPVWIAPLARVAEAFDPRTQRFDVVIIDEASQADALGLIAWYLGKSVVVVGDDQQVTPASVGERIEDMTSMIDTYLEGIPNRELYDGRASIYQLASTAFPGVVRLREHFRCVPDIISFSNSLSYGGDIVPLRDPSSARVGPPVVSYRVQAGHASGGSSSVNVNEDEARHIAALLVACLEQPEYQGLTFGVISLLGREQPARIEKILRDRVRPDQYQQRRILCGDPAQFQGDERDVVFLSMVTLPPERPPLPILPDPGEQFKKRYNVAASRARDQLWVVHSIDRQRDLKTEDLRWSLLQWAEGHAAASRLEAEAIGKAESPFEAEVTRRLLGAGYRVKPQYAVGAYRIDIVVEGASSRLAVECDGAAYHSSPEQIRSDLDRQALLERMGWQFYRIRGTDFYSDPEGAFRRLSERLDELGIKPLGPESQESASGASQWNDLLERVKRRASELLSEWFESSSYASGSLDYPRPDVGHDRSPAPSGPDPGPADDHEGGPGDAPQAPPPPLEPIAPRVQDERNQEIDNLGGLADVKSADAAAAYFRKRGLRVDDKRQKGGALWVYGSRPALESVMRTLQRNGVRFVFSNKRCAWYLAERRPR